MLCLAIVSLLTTLSRADDEAQEASNSLGTKLVRIAIGEFVMGAGEAPPHTQEEWNERDWDEMQSHKVKINATLFMAASEVTNAQYEQFDPEHKKLQGLH